MLIICFLIVKANAVVIGRNNLGASVSAAKLVIFPVPAKF